MDSFSKTAVVMGLVVGLVIGLSVGYAIASKGITESKQRNMELEGQLAEDNKRITTLNTLLTDAQSETKTLNATLMSAQNDISKLQSFIEKKDNQIADLQAQIDARIAKQSDYGNLTQYVQRLLDRGFEAQTGIFISPEYHMEFLDYVSFARWAERVRWEHQQKNMSDPIIFVDVEQLTFWFTFNISMFYNDEMTGYYIFSDSSIYLGGFPDFQVGTIVAKRIRL